MGGRRTGWRRARRAVSVEVTSAALVACALARAALTPTAETSARTPCAATLRARSFRTVAPARSSSRVSALPRARSDPGAVLGSEAARALTPGVALELAQAPEAAAVAE